MLNQELDYETIKNGQILKKTDKIQGELATRSLIDKSRLDQVVKQYESHIEQLEAKILDQEANPFDKLQKEKMERQI